MMSRKVVLQCLSLLILASRVLVLGFSLQSQLHQPPRRRHLERTRIIGISPQALPCYRPLGLRTSSSLLSRCNRPFPEIGALSASTTANDLAGELSSSSSSSDPLFTENKLEMKKNPEDLKPKPQQPLNEQATFQTTQTSEEQPAQQQQQQLQQQERVPFPIVLWRFSRPHTLIGSALAIPALHLLAAPTLQLSYSVWMNMIKSILFAVVPSLLMNIYITGLNQITDVEIDEINKPYLPIAAGILSLKNAIITVLVSLALSLWLGHFGIYHSTLSTPGLSFALWGSAVLGTLYSLPPFRLKRFPLLAAFCIVAVRGTIINAAFFAHAKSAVFGGTGTSVLTALATDSKCFLSSMFFCVFGVVIALMKDVPDVVGDETSNVRTFSVRLGTRQVFDGARRLLTGLFWAFGLGFGRAAILAPSLALAASRGNVAVAALVAGRSVQRQSRNVDPENSKQVYSFYMHLWKLFYLSYLALPFAR